MSPDVTAADRELAERTVHGLVMRAPVHSCVTCERVAAALANVRAEQEARVAALERERDGMQDGWKAANAHMEMLRQTIEDKYPAPPNFYLRALLTQVNEAQARVAALEAALLAILYASDQCVGHRHCGHSMEPWKTARRLVALVEPSVEI
jgi:hypothetical protein